MGRKINEDKYGISDRRYKELVYFCLQYREWKKWLKDNTGRPAGCPGDMLPKGKGGHSDPVAALAIKRQKLLCKCRALEMAAEEASPICTNLLVKNRDLCHNKSQGVIYYGYKCRRINKTFTRRIPAGVL